MFSAKARYALKLAVLLAQRQAWLEQGHCVTVRTLAEEGELRLPFLAKVVAELAAAEVVVARKGPGGGVMLARPPEQVSLADVVFAVDRLDDYQRCLLDDIPCRNMAACPMHHACRTLREDVLGNTTVADAAEAYGLCVADRLSLF